jgi:hypothetical protein
VPFLYTGCSSINDISMANTPAYIAYHVKDTTAGEQGEGIHLRRDNLSSIAYSEELISATISATLQSTDRHHGIVGQKCSHFQRDS